MAIAKRSVETDVGEAPAPDVLLFVSDVGEYDSVGGNAAPRLSVFRQIWLAYGSDRKNDRNEIQFETVQ